MVEKKIYSNRNCDYCNKEYTPKSGKSFTCCKKCSKSLYSMKQYKLGNSYFQKNPDKKRESANKYSKKAQVEKRTYRHKNPEKCKLNDFLYYEINKSKLKKQKKNYLNNNLEAKKRNNICKQTYSKKFKKENSLRIKIYNRYGINLPMGLVIKDYDLIKVKYEEIK